MSFSAAIDVRPTSGLQWGLLALASLLLLTDGFDNSAIAYAAPALLQDWRIDRTSLGLAFSSGQVGMMVGAFALSTLGDRIGARRVLIGCLIGYGGATLITALASSMPALVALRFLTGVAVGGAMPNAMALVADYAPTRHRTLMVAIAGCGFSLGSAFGGFLAALVMDDYGWRSVFVLGGLVPLLLLPAMWLWLPESPQRLFASDGLPRRLKAAIEKAAPGWTAPSAPAPSEGGAATPRVNLLRGDLRLASLLIWVAYFMNLLLLYFLNNWAPVIAHDAGLSPGQSSLTITAYQGGGTVGALLLAFFADRIGARPALTAAFLGGAACMVGLSLFGAIPAALMTILLVAGFCIVGGQIAMNAFVAGFYPPEMRSSGVGWALSVGRIASILGPFAGGVLMDSGAAPATLLGWCAGPALIAAMAISLVRRR